MNMLLHLDNIHWQGRDELSPLFHALQWSMREGERWAIMGKEGSGKSTLLRIMAGLLQPQRGTVRYRGTSLAHDTILPGLGVLFADAAQRFLTATVWEEVALTPAHQGVTGNALHDRVQHALQRAGLPESVLHWELSHLSSAQAYRVALAAVLVTQPVLLLLDEPGAPLDEAGEKALAQQLQGCSSVTFTSRLERAHRFANHLAWLEGGQLRVDALPAVDAL
ncbi:MAG: ABC transporter ATP-binding protein [Magnetococcales bacterium]|nr:ABC transporter ATP-binding protein [Magnetococcales bacterium]MBF0117133.1 ABC transporter ATP-binding protein [Magnetococcales bacterium]